MLVEIVVNITIKGALENKNPKVVMTFGAIHSGINSTSQLQKGL